VTVAAMTTITTAATVRPAVRGSARSRRAPSITPVPRDILAIKVAMADPASGADAAAPTPARP
jgi:hypothetical protein